MNLEQEIKKEDILFDSLIYVSLKTLFYLFLFLSLSISVFCLRFPFKAMNIFYELDMRSTSLAYCKRALNTESGENYYNSLIMGIELSDHLLTKTNKSRYAESLFSLTKTYALDEKFDQLNEKIDEFNQSQIILLTSNILTQLSFYSYKEYIYTQNLIASIKLNKSDKLLINASLIQIKDIDLLTLSNLNLTDLAIFFKQATILNDMDLLNLCEAVLPDYLNQATNQTGKKRLYLINAVLNLQESTKKDYTLIVNEQETSLKDYFFNLLEEL